MEPPNTVEILPIGTVSIGSGFRIDPCRPNRADSLRRHLIGNGEFPRELAIRMPT
jgi:hypothetical protein